MVEGPETEVNRSKRRERREGFRLRYLRFLLWTVELVPRLDVDLCSWLAGVTFLAPWRGRLLVGVARVGMEIFD